MNPFFFGTVTLVGDYSELIFDRMEDCQFHKNFLALSFLMSLMEEYDF